MLLGYYVLLNLLNMAALTYLPPPPMPPPAPPPEEEEYILSELAAEGGANAAQIDEVRIALSKVLAHSPAAPPNSPHPLMLDAQTRTHLVLRVDTLVAFRCVHRACGSRLSARADEMRHAEGGVVAAQR